MDYYNANADCDIAFSKWYKNVPDDIWELSLLKVGGVFLCTN